MESKKDIGKAFREKLDTMQQQPRDAVWEGILAELQSKKKKRRITPLWFSRIAAILVMLIAGGLLTLPYLKEDTKPEVSNPIVNPQGTNNTIVNETGKQQNAASTPGSQVTDKSSNTNNSSNSVVNNPENSDNYNNNNNATANNNNTLNNNTGNTKGAAGSQESANNTRTAVAGKDKINERGQNNASQSDKSNKQNTSNDNTRNRQTGVATSDNAKNSTGSNSKTAINQPDANAGVALHTTENKKPLGIYPDKNDSLKSDNGVTKDDTIAEDNTGTDTNVADADIDEEDAIADLDMEQAELEAKIKDSLKIEARNARIAQLREDSQEEDEEEEDDFDDNVASLEPEKFYVFVHGGPAFYNLPNNKSNIDPLLNNNTTSLETSFNYGAYLGFILNDKFSLRVGFINTKLERVTNNVTLQSFNTQNPAYPNGIMPPANYTGVEYRENVSNDAVLKTLGDDYTANISLVQRAEYYEFPVEAVYSLYGNRAGINAVGGFSAFYLRDNTVTAKNGNGSFNMGSLNGIKDLSISANLGLSLYYELTPGLKLNAEPLFKYHLSAFGGARLYSFNLQAGLQYTFNKNK